MVSYGKIIKSIRENKKMTQKELAEGIVTPQFLSQFENNKYDIKLDNFLMILDRLNVKYSEFIVHVLTSDPPLQSNFLNQYSKAYYSSNKVLLKKLVEQEKELYSENSNFRHLHNAIIASQRFQLINHNGFNRDDTNIIMDYLKDVYDWGHYEVALFANSMFFLDIEHMNYFNTMVINKIKKYGSKLRLNGEFSKVLLNMIDYLLKRNELEDIDDLISETETFLIGEKSFYEKNQLNYLKGLYYIKKGDIENGKNHCDKVISILVHFEEYENANHKQEEVDQLLQEIADE
ncbi:helix-turn-helix domain-containing protein [Ruoffia sp. FAM 24228]|uniref:Rgg/GadR/MutR family transcriptional regulator n=1 Tax=unclassified Ruoffia TaxID=2862149 RepID=UPI000EC24A28|nr:hypothetical protein [Aerococcaceae bacterium]